jgi:hypothetical protein
MSFDRNVNQARRRIDDKIRKGAFSEPDQNRLITRKGAALGFGIGIVMLGIVLCFRPLGVSSQADGQLFAIPIITAVAIPVLFSATRRIMKVLSSPRRRRSPDGSPPDAEPSAAGPPKVLDERTDEDFIPSDGPDRIEELRREIAQRLAAGATQREVEEEFSARGIDPQHAIALVSSVRTSGRRTMPTEPLAEFRLDDPGDR